MQVTRLAETYAAAACKITGTSPADLNTHLNEEVGLNCSPTKVNKVPPLCGTACGDTIIEEDESKKLTMPILCNTDPLESYDT
jgi:hypothetical protein